MTPAGTGSAPSATVRVLGDDDIDAASAVLAGAFLQEPGARALLPDASLREQVARVKMRSALDVAVPRGVVHGAMVDERVAAVAVWLPPGTSAASTGAKLRMVPGLVTLSPNLLAALPGAVATMTRSAPQLLGLLRRRRRAVEEAARDRAWCLALLGTAPERQGRGLARLLLDRQLRRCDEDALPVWLETTDPVNPPLYERFGFTTTLQVSTAAWLPGYWVMRREPRPAAETRA